MPSEPASVTDPRPLAGSPRWYVFLAWLLRGFYFCRVRVIGALSRPAKRRVVICSHRSGAIDGYCLMKAFPEARFLLSVQLWRKWLLRLMFTGIPVVRDKDTERYGINRQDYGNPVLAACRHLRQGGSLAMFPEGSSEWGPHPLPYQPGTALIVRLMLAEGVDVEVVPVGLYYRAPDRFRSDVDVLVGEPVVLPAQDGCNKRDWEARIEAELARALDAVSVNCPDMPTFERVERLAARDADASPTVSYAQAFQHWQQRAAEGGLPEAEDARVGRSSVRAAPLWSWPFIALVDLFFAPVLLAGYWIGKRADARNTVAFFRMVGGFAAALVWLPVLAVSLLLLLLFVPQSLPYWVAVSLLMALAWRYFGR